MERRRSKLGHRFWLALLSSSTFFSTAALATAQFTPEQRYFEWAELAFDADVYADRRARLAALLKSSGGGVLLVPGRQGPSDGFSFRQLDDFIYLTGLELPDSLLAVDSGTGRATMFAPARDARFENPSRRNDFPGRPLRDDAELIRRSGIQSWRDISELDTALQSWTAGNHPIRMNFGREGKIELAEPGYLTSWSSEETLLHRLRQKYPQVKVTNAYAEMARMRMVHGPEEIEAMRRVCDLTVEAIRHAASFIEDGIDERGLEAELEAAFKRGGSQRLAFASIIKSGPNSLWAWRILAAHYDRRNRIMRDGELVIFDVGTELNYYVSDVGRTFPVSGKFTERQKDILLMETAVSDAIIAAIEPGVTLAELKALALEAIPDDQEPFMQAGGFYGHHIGLSTGDPNLYDVPLEPGMIFTVEPWYYNHQEGISVFTEDVILVTEHGAENLTEGLPRTPEALEALTGRNR